MVKKTATPPPAPAAPEFVGVVTDVANIGIGADAYKLLTIRPENHAGAGIVKAVGNHAKGDHVKVTVSAV